MDKVLIAEDDPRLLELLKDGLQKYKDQFEITGAKDGKEAMEVLKKETISLLVTDVQMPNVDGLALLTHMTEYYPAVPCIVMTAHSTTEIKKAVDREGVINCIEKPFEIADLADGILKGLEFASQGGEMTGISLSNFLQLIENEEKTCLLEVNEPARGKGLFYFQEGVLYDALFGSLKGQEAALEMAAWDNVEISFKNIPQKKIKKKINMGVMALILEATRLKDDATDGGEDDPVEPDAIFDPDLCEKLSTRKEDADVFDEEREKSVENSHINELGKLEDEETIKQIEEVLQMALETFLEELKSVKGYKAAGIMNFTGEILASNSIDPNIDLGLVGATFNDIFRSAHEASEKIGLRACTETVINTPMGIIVMVCSGTESKTHFHIIGILDAEGNQALMKMQLEKMIPGVMKEIT